MCLAYTRSELKELDIRSICGENLHVASLSQLVDCQPVSTSSWKSLVRSQQEALLKIMIIIFNNYHYCD